MFFLFLASLDIKKIIMAEYHRTTCHFHSKTPIPICQKGIEKFVIRLNFFFAFSSQFKHFLQKYMTKKFGTGIIRKCL